MSPNERRKNRHPASVMDLPTTTFHRMFEECKVFKRITSAASPKLTTGNKRLHIMRCLEKADPTTNDSQTSPM